MSSSVQICNRALIRIKADLISSLEGSATNEIIANTIYDSVRRSLLRAHNWNFATEYVELAQLTDSPVFKFDFAYQLPSDCLRVLDLHGTEEDFKVIGNKLYTDTDAAYLIYIKDVTDTGSFDVLFEECLVLKLAYELCFYITGSAPLTAQLLQEFELKFKEAKRADGQEDIPDSWSNGTIIDSRF